MATPFATLCRLWVTRFVMLLVAGLMVVALSFLPQGVVPVEGKPQPSGYLGVVRTDPTVPFRVAPMREPSDAFKQTWSLRHYGSAVGSYWQSLRTGQLTILNWDQYPPKEEPLLPELRRTWLLSLDSFLKALAIGLVGGCLLGPLILGRRLVRGLSLGISVLGLALPEFFLVLLGQMATIWTYKTYGFRLWSVLGPQGGERGWILPLIALSFMPLAYTARLVATSLDEVMRAEYIRTARAKGIPEFWVVAKHALRNAIPRVLNGFPSLLNAMLSSLLVVEVFTSSPGLGSLLMQRMGPQLVATVGLLFCLWFMIMDGLANTVRILANPQLGGRSR